MRTVKSSNGNWSLSPFEMSVVLGNQPPGHLKSSDTPRCSISVFAAACVLLSGTWD
jgi:hypothetical protein